jgi:hypothetical protein
LERAWIARLPGLDFLNHKSCPWQPECFQAAAQPCKDHIGFAAIGRESEQANDREMVIRVPEAG